MRSYARLKHGVSGTMKTHLLVACCTLVVLAACSIGSHAVEQARPSITLERTLCYYGRCPSYRMTVYSDGAYVWEGRKYVSVTGTRRGFIERKRFEDAMRLLNDARYLEFKDTYSGGNECSIWATDNPSAIVEVVSPTESKRIDHYLGCEGFDRRDELLRVERQLDEIFGTRRFIGGR